MKKLAACVQIVPAVESVYEWKGKLVVSQMSAIQQKGPQTRRLLRHCICSSKAKAEIIGLWCGWRFSV